MAALLREADREPVDLAPIPGNAGIRARYAIDAASWVWHPGIPVDEDCQFMEFACSLTLQGSCAFEVSADQRFILFLDDAEIGRGPDRAELHGWSFHRYRLRNLTGRQRLRALVWWLAEASRPAAQVSARPAFAVAGLGEAASALSTGLGPWQVRRLGGWQVRSRSGDFGYHVIGSGFRFDGGASDGPWVPVEEVARGQDNLHGTFATPWRCEPSPLPEQARALFSGGCVRIVQPGGESRMGEETDSAEWSGLCHGEPVEIGPNRHLTVLWDLQDYICGYPRVRLRGGLGSRLALEWAESLYLPEGGARVAKGRRDTCAGKYWLGFGDEIRHAGGERIYEMPWWRSGRWLRLDIKTGSETLVIEDARPLTTAHPFSRQWAFSDGMGKERMLDLCERALRQCTHETFVDCPYYEQMQYVGDTRIQALVWLAATGDLRPVQRSLQLFDRSRWVNGFVAERCPSHFLQMSATYSLIQPLMLRDYAMWTDDDATVRRLLPGTRSAMEAALACLDADDLPRFLPGWLFIDWVKEPDWRCGNPAREDGELTAPLALHLPMALSALAAVEDAFGETLMAQRWRGFASRIFDAIHRTFWDPDRHCFADTVDRARYSEHAQAMALAYRELPDALRAPLIRALIQPLPEMARATVYFSFYVIDALLTAGHIEAVETRWEFWRELEAKGLCTTLEAPEPARSDCHAWGAHPLFHCLAGKAGIEPEAPGFARVCIRPKLGASNQLSAQVPHPKGLIRVACKILPDHRLHILVDSPVDGTLHWQDQSIPFAAGRAREWYVA